MKNKYLLICMTLSALLAISGCSRNEMIQEDIAHSQESYNNVRNNASEETDIQSSLNENTYFLSENGDFHEKATSNPIDQNYVIDAEAPTLEIWQSALTKCEAWNQQIDFTGSKLESLLSEEECEQLHNAISLWHEYYQAEVEQNRELYGSNGMIPGSMYTVTSADVLVEKCKLTSFALLSHEYELSGNVSFVEDTAVTDHESECLFLPQAFCIEYTPDFEEVLSSYSLNEKNSDELEGFICEIANKIEEKFEHNFTEHANKYVSFIHELYSIENGISEDVNRCLVLEENRLRVYAIELLNVLYMLDGQ